jgi:hypothetical protein
VSPPSGVAAAGTRCTVSGTVQRAWMPPRHWMRGKRLPDATSQVSLVDYQQIRVGHPRSALARHPVAAGQQHLRMHQRFSAGQLRRTHPSTSVAAGSAVNDCSTVGRPSRTASASRAITCRSAPTSGGTGVGDLAESVPRRQHRVRRACQFIAERGQSSSSSGTVSKLRSRALAIHITSRSRSLLIFGFLSSD